MKSCSLCKKPLKVGNGPFFNVPKEEDRRAKWSEICQITFTPTSHVCVDHFHPSQIIKGARRSLLMPNAVPVSPLLSEKNINNPAEPVLTPRLLNRSNCDIPPQLQETPIIQLPVMNTVSCSVATQTNIRICGQVQASDYSDEFRLNCFYCSEVFPLEKWNNFVNHLKSNHLDLEEVFEKLKFVSNDHDYTPINVSPKTATYTSVERIVTNTKLPPFLKDPLEPLQKPFESVVLNSFIYSAFDENIPDTSGFSFRASGMLNKLGNCKAKSKFFSSNKSKAISNLKQEPRRTAVFRYVRKTNKSDLIMQDDRDIQGTDDTGLPQQKAAEISFQYTPRETVDLLLDSMKNYPVLWKFDYGPFNEQFYEAVKNICQIINDKWSLNIDNLRMRRSINRILRFYCCLFLNTNVENVDQYSNYYAKCAGFLPPSVNEIAYARCSHCYICYRNDFDLRRHLLEEQKYLQWPYSCERCKECFRDSYEYEFHQRLPHYDEIFKCKSCNKTFDHRNMYNKHMSNDHPKNGTEPAEYKCDICTKAFYSRISLRNHKIIHGERKYKCHLCPKSYYLNARLALHLKSHRKEYDFICEVCGKAFVFQSNLRQHMKKHTGAKVTCNICNLKLRKSSLSRHLRLVHVAYEGTVEATFRAKNYHYKRFLWPRPLRRKKERESRKYSCKNCNIIFENYKLIVEHNRELHSDIPKWSCKLCSAQFSHKINLNGHYRKKHNLPVIQVFKLTHEIEDLNAVSDDLSTIRDVSKHKPTQDQEAGINGAANANILPHKMFLETERVHSSTIQDEIMKDADNNVAQENKIDYINDLTDFLQGQ